MHLGSQRLVVLCGYEMVKAALVDRAEDFASRPSVPLLEKTNNGHGGSRSTAAAALAL